MNNLPIEQIQKELDALIKMGLVKVIVENGETKYQAIGPHPEDLKNNIRGDVTE